MKTRTALWVVVATAVVLGLGLVGVVVVGRLVQGLRSHLSSEAARQQFVTDWRPPSEFSRDAVFPGRVDGYTAGEVETNPKVADPAIDLPGFRTTYSQPGRPEIEVFVARANALESEAIFQRARAVFQGRSGTKTAVEGSGRLRLSGSQPAETMELWSLQGWLVLFRAKGELEAGFIRSYLVAVRGRSGRQP